MTGLKYDSAVVQKETFAPIVYLLKCDSVEQAVQWNNSVKQGLSSSIFTKDLGTIFNVSGISGVEIGSRFASRLLMRTLFPHSGSAPRAPTAASSTSTSPPTALRSEVPSVARSTPAAAGSRAPTRGSSTCAGPPSPSTTARSCPSLRASSSSEAEPAVRPCKQQRTWRGQPASSDGVASATMPPTPDPCATRRPRAGR